ncbi:hypothetical protein LIER_28706 [Lithospermum erythrorhizon]|uniref:DUF4283 domain-containing protein n=1 Tax=Lithospermum erythrorhizon TaxID=34254 RepID=A0AAV3RK21_LITER
MDATIIRSLLKCKLSETELKRIQLVEEDLAEGIIECELSAYAKVLSLKESFVSIQGMKMALSKAWNCQDIRISRITGPIIHIFFPSLSEKKRIIETGSWCFDNQLVVMNDWARGVDPVTISFDKCTFWI